MIGQLEGGAAQQGAASVKLRVRPHPTRCSSATQKSAGWVHTCVCGQAYVAKRKRVHACAAAHLERGKPMSSIICTSPASGWKAARAAGAGPPAGARWRSSTAAAAAVPSAQWLSTATTCGGGKGEEEGRGEGKVRGRCLPGAGHEGAGMVEDR